MASNRIIRINEEVKRELAGVIRELKDPRIPIMTSVVSVNVTNDLRYAKVYVSVLGDDNVKKEALKGLKQAAGFARREVSRRVNLRISPELIFELDSSIEHGAHINEIIQNLDK